MDVTAKITISAALQLSAVLLQCAAAVYSLKLIRVTGRQASWLLISGALVIMALRRSFSLVRLFSGTYHPTGLWDEATALAISVCMLAGVLAISPLFHTIKSAAEALRRSRDELETQVAERTAELSRTNVELQQEIEERKQAEEALRAERQRLFALLDGLPAFVYLKAPDGSIRFANRTFRDLFGEPGGRRCYEVIQERGEPCESCQSFQVLETGKPQNRELSLGADAHTFQVSDYPFADVDGSPLIMTLGIDITARKQTEGALRESEKNLRYLASQLLTTQERERKRISRELHDELGQSLLVLKLQLRTLDQKLAPGQEAVKKDCDHILAHLDQVIENVRRLSRDLSPSILEDLGLSAALRRLIRDFAKHYEIKEHLVTMDEIDDVFAPGDKINLYRIFQESLTNIGKYAQATRLTISIKRHPDRVSFRVEDNGRGFNLAQVLGGDIDGRGLGLAAMEERVRMLGGVLDIRSREGKGTKICFEVPIAREEKP